MKRLLHIAIWLLTATLLASCEEEGDVFTTQQNSIEKYLTSTRRMVAEEQIGDVIEDNPPFYSTFGRYAYRHIVNYYEAGRDEWSVIEPGDRVEIEFNAYLFSGSEPSISNVYWSNIPATISKVEASNNNPYADLDWSEEPLSFVIGNGEVVKGVDEALIGCHDQDSVQVYMTYTMAYDKRLVGTVPKRSSIAWYMKIVNVIK